MKFQANTVFPVSLPRLAFLLALSLFFAQDLAAQKLKFGPRIGFASSAIIPQQGDGFDGYFVSLRNSSPELQLGFFGRVQLFGLYVQPEFLFTTASAKYLVEDLINGGTEIFDEQYYNVEIPMMAGIKLGPIRAQGGPVYRLDLGHSSDFFSRAGFGRSFKESEVGFRAGLGLDLGRKIILDLNYEFNVFGGGDDITIFGQQHTLSDRGSQLVASMGISF